MHANGKKDPGKRDSNRSKEVEEYFGAYVDSAFCVVKMLHTDSERSISLLSVV